MWYALQALLLLFLFLFIVCPRSDVVVWCTLHLAGEPPLEQSELSANAMYAGETTQATLECESLVSTVDRGCAESLSHFSDLCVDELQETISPILRTKFGHNSVTSRNTGFAKKSMFRDLRCP